MDQSDKAYTYFFVHIPKTAGTSFRTMLEGYFKGKEIFPAKADRLKSEHLGYPDRGDYLHLEKDELSKIKILAGHLPFAMGRSISPNLRMLTFLREPEERYISHINYIHRKRLKQHKDQNLMETYAHLKGSIHNMQVRYLADHSGEDLQFFKRPNLINEIALEQAKENLMSCDFFGISEQFTASIMLAEKTLGWKLGRVRNVNKNLFKTHQLPAEILREMEKALVYDQELYRFACEVFEKRKKGRKKSIFLRSIKPF